MASRSAPPRKKNPLGPVALGSAKKKRMSSYTLHVFVAYTLHDYEVFIATLFLKMKRKPRFQKKTDTAIYFLWGLVIFNIVFNIFLLIVFMNFEGTAGKDGVNGKDGKDGIASLDDIEVASLHVASLHVHDIQILDSLETYGTVDMYGSGNGESSDSRRLLANKRDHCTNCEKKFSDPNTCVNSCSSHIKLEKTGFGEVFHECCQN